MKGEGIAHEYDESNYWDIRYLNNETGWDLQQVSPPLQKYIDGIKSKELSILIPGCGNAYEAGYLLKKGFTNVTLIDISQVLTNRLKATFKKNPSLQIINENYFNHLGSYDLILEQTFFCALHPSYRQQYVHKTYELLQHSGKVAGLLFYKKMVLSEPPYIATEKEYQQLFSKYFVFKKFEKCLNSVQPRLGSELFFEFEKSKA